MLGNGTLSYDHDRDGRPTQLGGCPALVRNSIHDTFLLVRYSGNRLRVRAWFSSYMLTVPVAKLAAPPVANTRNCSSDNGASVVFDWFLLTVTQLMVNVDGQQEWKECADITGLRLPTGYFFGASSATGDLSGMGRVFRGSERSRK